MKIIVQKDDLLNSINITQKAVPSKPSTKVLEGILVEAKNNKVKLTAYDSEIGIESYINADIRSEGAIVISAKIFGDIVKRLPDGEVIIETTEQNNIIIECIMARYDLNGIDAREYPAIPSIESENPVTLKQNELKNMIRQTGFAAAINHTRPIFNGILLDCCNGEINVVAIDGFRMAHRFGVYDKKDEKIKVIIPSKTMMEISKILEESDKEVTIYSSFNLVSFETENFKIVSRIIDGEYLDYKTIIPDEYETRIVIKTKEIQESVERIALLSDEDNDPAIFKIDDEKLIITSSSDIGSAKDEISIEMEGKLMEVGFSPRYFIDALRVIEDEKIQIIFTSSIGPCLIKSLSNGNYRYMILPIRIRNDQF